MPPLAVFEEVRVAGHQRVAELARRGDEDADIADYCAASQSASTGEVKSVSFAIVTVPLSAPWMREK